MKRANCWIFIMVTLVLSACGSEERNNEISGSASFDSSNSEREVYITPYGKRYHHDWCRTIQGHSVKTTTLEKAERKGRTPCHVCY